MSPLYIGYLALALGGTFLLLHVFNVKFSPQKTKAMAFALILVAILFTIWDILAVMRGHWSFGLHHTLGMMVINQPIEEIGFFLVIPLFGIALYEIARSKGGKKR